MPKPADAATPPTQAAIVAEFFAARQALADALKEFYDRKRSQGVKPAEVVFTNDLRSELTINDRTLHGWVFRDDLDQAELLEPASDRHQSARSRLLALHPRLAPEFRAWEREQEETNQLAKRGVYTAEDIERLRERRAADLAAWQERFSAEPLPAAPHVPYWIGCYPDEGIQSAADLAAYVKRERSTIALLEEAENKNAAPGYARDVLANVSSAAVHFGLADLPECVPTAAEPLTTLKGMINRVVLWAEAVEPAPPTAEAAASEAINADGRAAEADALFIPNPFQTSILRALEGVALKKDALAAKVCGGDGSRLYKSGGLKELRAAGRVSHKNQVGYFRPDAPPNVAEPNRPPNRH